MIHHSYRAIYQSHVEVEKSQWNALHARMRSLEKENQELKAELKTYKDVKANATDTTARPVGEQQQSPEADDSAPGATKPRAKRTVKGSTGPGSHD